MPTIELLMTGSELMSGDNVDTNSAMIAQLLGDTGLSVTRKTTLGDDLPLLSETIETISKRADVLIVNGGLGPTTDDLTAEALAQAAGDKVVEHPEARAHIEAWCARRGMTVTPPNLKQAWLPQDCSVIPNPVGSAVGFYLQLNHCLIICTPGVPAELRAMMTETILPLIQTRFDHLPRFRTLKFQVFGLGESRIQQRIAEALSDLPAELSIGYRASLPAIEVKLTAPETLDEAMHRDCFERAKALFGHHVLGDDGRTNPEIVLDLLRDQGKTVVTIESCTGGMIASAITRIAGASEVFEAGLVTYSNAMKTRLVGVPEDTLAQFGAVSQAVVEEMLTGGLDLSGAAVGVAVSGIAGPSGGTTDKPVGTVWIAWGQPGHIRSRCLWIPGNRAFFQQVVTHIALDLVRRELLGIDEAPQYFVDRMPKQDTTPDKRT